MRQQLPFGESVRRASELNRTRTVLALDLEDKDPSVLIKRCEKLLREVGDQICAVKINRQLVLTLGLTHGVDVIVDFAHSLSLPTIMDAKLNDVAHTNAAMTRAYLECGFDAIIASPIVGWEDGLDSVFELMNKAEKSIILLVHMSNPGSENFYSLMVGDTKTPIFERFAELALLWKAHGVVVGATKPDVISRVREMIGDELQIYSPGVGFQGGDGKRAIQAGANYIIVGRSIYSSPDPGKSAREMRFMTTGER
ncbi:MAG TPA: orotidine-5'-phosphate decarboxylase [Candidatus Bathyarchaeia archaeon]|nr:orotidine-5'-phosphate decarboxylase [Candidatus Bathyarchaeia archaeon]